MLEFLIFVLVCACFAMNVLRTDRTNRISWRRGFFRLWAFLTLLWIGTGAYVTYSDLPPAPDATELAAMRRISNAGPPPTGGSLPAASDPWAEFRLRPAPPSSPPTPAKDIDFSAYVNAPIDYSDLPSARRVMLREAAAWIFLPPLAVLMLGIGIGWCINGFRTRNTTYTPRKEPAL
jgi:hypothetical protein